MLMDMDEEPPGKLAPLGEVYVTRSVDNPTEPAEVQLISTGQSLPRPPESPQLSPGVPKLAVGEKVEVRTDTDWRHFRSAGISERAPITRKGVLINLLRVFEMVYMSFPSLFARLSSHLDALYELRVGWFGTHYLNFPADSDRYGKERRACVDLGTLGR